MVVAVANVVQPAFAVPAVAAVEGGPCVDAAEGDGRETGVQECGLAVRRVTIAFEDAAGGGDETGDVPIGVLNGVQAIDERRAAVTIAEHAIVDVAQAPDELLLVRAG